MRTTTAIQVSSLIKLFFAAPPFRLFRKFHPPRFHFLQYFSFVGCLG